MANAKNIQILNVFLHGQVVGQLSSDNAELEFRYNEAHLKKENAIKLSASLPLQSDPFNHQVSTAFFSGLLPDEMVRKRLARYLGLSEQNTFALLKEIGGECAGAVSVYPEGQSRDTHEEPRYRILEDKEAYDILSSLDKRPMMVGEGDIRISGAGAQDKLIISLIDGKIAIPMGNTASTHIIKPAIKDLDGSVFNEFFCMKLAKAMKLPAPNVFIHWIENEPYYLIERYDRRIDDSGNVDRLHQEDFCQALRIPPELKYEDEGGPTLMDCFALLDKRIKKGYMAGVNKLILLRGVIFNYLIGNGDAHGKNFSILYDGEAESLAPFYDLMSTVIYSDHFKAKMAMKVAGHYKFREIVPRHFDTLAETIGIKTSLMQSEIGNLRGNIVEQAEALRDDLNKNPMTKSPIYETIVKSLNTL